MAPEYIYGSAAMGHRVTMRHGERERRGEEKRKKEWERIDDPCADRFSLRAMTNFGKRERKKEKKKKEERMFPCTRKTVVWHRAFYNAETRKGQLRARLSSNHLTFFSESRLPRAILPFSSLQQLLR